MNARTIVESEADRYIGRYGRKGYAGQELWAGPGGLLGSAHGHEQAAVDYLNKTAPELGIEHSGGEEETVEDRYATYAQMERRKWVRVEVTHFSIFIDSTPDVRDWDDLPKAARDGLEAIAFEHNLSIQWDRDTLAERPRP
jgi:hypothetical protein